MLRISVQNGPLTTRFKLEGKLAHEWVGEAQKAWSALNDLHGKKKVIVDLFDVEFVDDLGSQLLAEMNRTGAKLVGSGPMMSALIEEIEGNEAAQEESSTAD
jgi:anti-anti-sigma regulatory factor